MLNYERYFLHTAISSSTHTKFKKMSGVARENGIQCDGNKGTVPLLIEITLVQDSIISIITTKVPVTPARFCPILAPVDCDLSLAPPSCLLVIPSDNLITEGYDSECQIDHLSRGESRKRILSR